MWAKIKGEAEELKLVHRDTWITTALFIGSIFAMSLIFILIDSL